MARALIDLHHASPHDYTDIRRIRVRGGDYAKLTWWKLIEPHPTNSRWWRLTRQGRAFVRNRALVPKFALAYNGRCYGLTGPLIRIKHAIGSRFSYTDLMAGR